MWPMRAGSTSPATKRCVAKRHPTESAMKRRRPSPRASRPYGPHTSSGRQLSSQPGLDVALVPDGRKDDQQSDQGEPEDETERPREHVERQFGDVGVAAQSAEHQEDPRLKPNTGDDEPEVDGQEEQAQGGTVVK